MPQLSLPCPHCLSAKIGFAPRAIVRGSTDQQSVLFLQCEGCGHGLVAEIPTHPLNVQNWMQGAAWVFPDISDTYPAVPQLYCPADVPNNVRNAYLSGLDNLGRTNGANAAAMMFRRAVELAAKKLIPTAKPGDKLVKLIADLPPDSVTPAMKQWAHHVRLDWRVEVCVPRCLALSFASVTASRPCHVSSPRLVERSIQISRTALSCLLRPKAYRTYPAGATFDSGRRTL
jgi:hypothetical protein